MNTAAILVLALCLDAALGEPRWLWQRLPHPAVLMGHCISGLEGRLNNGSARRAKGLLAAALLSFGALVLGWALGLLGPVVEVAVVAILLAQRSLVQHVAAVADGLRMSPAQGQRAVAMIVSRDTGGMSQSQIARAAIESGSENLSDGVVAPAFWFLLGGLPGLLLYKIINTADSMIGYRNERFSAFGWAAARFDDLLNLIPARLTAALIALPAGVTDLRGIAADAALHRSPNAGWPEAAMSRVLGIALAGPRAYHGMSEAFPWVNAGARAALGPDDIDAAVKVMWRAWAAGLGLTALWAILI